MKWMITKTGFWSAMPQTDKSENKQKFFLTSKEYLHCHLLKQHKQVQKVFSIFG